MSLFRSLFHGLSRTLSKRHIYLTSSLNYHGKPQQLPVNFDYVRHATLGLCAEEIKQKQVVGSLAELGVYRGDFAKRMNFLFPEKKLYLFDTFTGFSRQDIEIDQQNKYSSGTQDFSDTAVDQVLAKMPYKQNCIVKKGMFPDSLDGLEDSFCLVSIDVDLYEPTYQGLLYFYPRLSPGGYIFIHDYNNKEYKGVSPAVQRFCSDNKINYLPIPDIGGSVIITK